MSRSRNSGSGFGGLFGKFSKPFKTQPIGTSKTSSPPIRTAQDLSLALKRTSALENYDKSSRLEAVERIKQTPPALFSIEKITSFIEPLLRDPDNDCRRAGFELMTLCIEHDVNSYRQVYYGYIVQYWFLEGLDLQIVALQKITNNGTNASDLFETSHRLPILINEWLREVSRLVVEKPILPYSNKLYPLLDFTNAIIQYNSQLFRKSDILGLLKEVIPICKKTFLDQDVLNCSEVFHSLIKYAFLPMEKLTEVVEMLCLSYNNGNETLKEQCWDILVTASKSNISNNIFISLCKLLEKDPSPRGFSLFKGASQFLQKLLTIYAEEAREEHLTNRKVMQAYVMSIDACYEVDLTCYIEILSSIYNLLHNPKTLDRFSYDSWESGYSPFEVVYQISCFNDLKKYHSHAALSILPENLAKVTKRRNRVPDNSKAVEMENIIVSILKKIIDLVADLYESDSFKGSKESLIDFFLDVKAFIEDKHAFTVINHFQNSHFCDPLSNNWKNNTSLLVRAFFNDVSWSSEVRISVIDVIYESYTLAREFRDSTEISEFLSTIYTNINMEQNPEVLDKLMSIFEQISNDCTLDIFETLSDLFLKSVADISRRRSVGSYISVGTDFTSGKTPAFSSMTPSTHAAGGSINGASTNIVLNASLDTRRRVYALTYCKIFVNTYRSSSIKAQMAYMNLIKICKSSANDPLSFIEAARLLFRIRVTEDNFIYLTSPDNLDILSPVVGHYEVPVDDNDNHTSLASWSFPEITKTSYLTNSEPEDRRMSVFSDLPDSSSMVEGGLLTFYDTSGGLDKPSWVLKLLTEENDNQPKANNYELDISEWLHEIIRVIENNTNTEILSYVWAHLGSQLSNVQLFQKVHKQIDHLRKIILDKFNTKQYIGIYKFDIKVAALLTLPYFIPYIEGSSKRDKDLISFFISGLSNENTIIPSLHCLICSCHEISHLVQPQLSEILKILEAKVTINLEITSAIFDFLLLLAKLPAITEKLTQEDYKLIFGAALKYIKSLSESTRRDLSSNHSDDLYSSISTSRCVLAFSYSVMSTWFLALKLPNRKFMVTYLIKNLSLAQDSQTRMDPLSLSFVEFISRFSFSNIDLNTRPRQTSLGEFDRNSSFTISNWLYGSSIVSIRTSANSGESYIKIRRPTGTDLYHLTPDQLMLPGWMEDSTLGLKESISNADGSERFRIDGTGIFSPSYIFLQLMVPVDADVMSEPVTIPFDEKLQNVFRDIDSTPVVDWGKVGVVYIEPGQKISRDIFRNTMGSLKFNKFLNDLGKLVRLKDNHKLYTVGMNVDATVDGDYACVWSDKTTQLIFESPSLTHMGNAEDDSTPLSIENHLVKILFDESGLSFDPTLLGGPTNFINIVISPVSFSSLKGFDNNLDKEPVSPSLIPVPNRKELKANELKQFYKVRIYKKSDLFPFTFLADQAKIVSKQNLAGFVRSLAINSCKFATVFQGGPISNWQVRLEFVNSLKTSTMLHNSAFDLSRQSGQISVQHTLHSRSVPTDGIEVSNVTQSFLEQLQEEPPSKEVPDVSQSFLDQLQ
jgi:hypothetical protein